MDGDLLDEIEVLAVDCQASGSTPAYGDLLELGWGTCTSAGLAGPVESQFVVPRTERPIPFAVRDLIGWDATCAAQAVDERQAWMGLRGAIARTAAPPDGVARAVIHFARFELWFLRDLFGRVDGGDRLPLDVVCLHAIATRLFPDLPRRNIRALAGYLGHSPEQLRRSAGHVQATAFIWRAFLPLLRQTSVNTWADLKSWLDQPAPRRAARARRIYPLASERRRALPDSPGVYRFLRRNGDILYVGKAASLKHRVAGHFKSRGAATERGLELLTQVHDIDPTLTASLVEAALLETDEIKRLDPPYNIQLRSAGRQAWFASTDLRQAMPAPDDAHRIGPLPSERALQPLAALTALCEGQAHSPALCAAALGVPPMFLPDAALFAQGLRAFVTDLAEAAGPNASADLARTSRALWLLRGRCEPERDLNPAEGAGPADWDLARVRRRLDRGLVQTGLLMRRARVLCLLADATVAFRERKMAAARVLMISGGVVHERRALDEGVMTIATWPAAPTTTHQQRQACFDAAVYDRLRVLSTELRRVRDEGGEVALRIGRHTMGPDRVTRLMRSI
jgi:DNA polymerase-3 subunit epsilon